MGVCRYCETKKRYSDKHFASNVNKRRLSIPAVDPNVPVQFKILSSLNFRNKFINFQ